MWDVPRCAVVPFGRSNAYGSGSTRGRFFLRYGALSSVGAELGMTIELTPFVRTERRSSSRGLLSIVQGATTHCLWPWYRPSMILR